MLCSQWYASPGTCAVVRTAMHGKDITADTLRACLWPQAELKDRIKTALLGKVPTSQPIQYNFDS